MHLAPVFVAFSTLFWQLHGQQIKIDRSAFHIQSPRTSLVSQNITPSTIPQFTVTPTSSQIIPENITPTTSPTTTPSPTSTPTPIPSSQPDQIQSYIMQQINDYRKSQGLAEAQIDSYTCNFAKTRALEITTNFSHKGFEERADSKTLPYPTYSLVTENIELNSNYKDVVSRWIASSGHARNMRRDTPFVCVERNGNYYAYEGWKP